MLLRKTGLPEEDEFVLCTVTKIYFQSVFVIMDEYDKPAMIPISEIAPGRIRNIRDFVKEGKKVVCKVLRIDTAKGHVDLSLRRVNEAQRREKLSQIKQEHLAENIVDFLAKKLKKDVKKLYGEITIKLFEKYESLYEAFEETVNGTLDLSKFIDKKIAKELTELIKQRIKPPIVHITGDLSLISYQPDGVEIIKQGLKKGLSKVEDVTVKYKGAGTFKVTVQAEDYKTAEKNLAKFTDQILDFMKSYNSEANFVRADG